MSTKLFLFILCINCTIIASQTPASSRTLSLSEQIDLAINKIDTLITTFNTTTEKFTPILTRYGDILEPISKNLNPQKICFYSLVTAISFYSIKKFLDYDDSQTIQVPFIQSSIRKNMVAATLGTSSFGFLCWQFYKNS